MSKTVSRKRLKWRKFFLKALSLVACVGPLAAVCVLRFDEYVTTVGEGIKLAGGGAILLVLIGLIALGKLKVPPRAVTYALVALISWLILPILADLTVLCLFALGGELVDFFIIKRLIRRTEEALLVDKTADETSKRVTKQVEEMFKNYTGRV